MPPLPASLSTAFPDLALTDDIGWPVDQIAGGTDGRGRANPETPAWVLDQLLTAEQGLRAVTIDGAQALGDEALELGTDLRVGLATSRS